MLPAQRVILGELLLEGPQARPSCYNQVKDAQDQTVGIIMGDPAGSG